MASFDGMQLFADLLKKIGSNTKRRFFSLSDEEISQILSEVSNDIL